MHSYFFSSPILTVSILEHVYRQISPTRMDEVQDDRFSPREAIAHLADWEPIFQTRIRGGVENDDFVITTYDESERAVTEQYSGQEVELSLRKFRAAREETMKYVRTLTEEQLRRELTHPEYGVLQVADIVTMLCAHDVYHIEHLTHFVEDKKVGTW